MIAALVAEYFGGPADGIGTAIATYAKSGRAALAWAYVARRHRHRPRVLPRHLAARAARDEAVAGLTGTTLHHLHHLTRKEQHETQHQARPRSSRPPSPSRRSRSRRAPAPSDSDDSGDGDFEPLTSIKLQLQWLPQAQFAGYYVALDQGYFEEEGFDDVEIIPSGGDIVPQDALVAGDVDFADRLGSEGARHPRGHRASS